MLKTCPKCDLQLPLDNFTKNQKRKDGRSCYCKVCADSYRKKDLRKRTEYQKARRRAIRSEIIKIYGGRCVCCGEMEEKFLSFDHINGGGNQHKNTVGRSEKFLRWIINNNYPRSLQILCHNCNQAKGAWGKCPHEEVLANKRD